MLFNQNNHLLNLARREKPLRITTRWFYPILTLFFGIIALILAQLVLMVPYGTVRTILTGSFNPDPFASGSPFELFAFLVLGFLPIFLFVALWLQIFEKRPLTTTGMERNGAIQKYLKGVGIGLLLMFSTIAVMSILGYAAIETPTATQLTPTAVAGSLLLLLGWIVQGAGEEVLTRGFLLPIIGLRWGTAAGVILSSLFFALLHFANPNVSLIAGLNLFLFGVFTALYALKEGGLWGVFAIHSIWNWVQGNLFGFEVSGQEALAKTASFFDLMEVGPDNLTGGAFGPEGGFIVSFILIFAIIIILFISKHSNQTE